MDVRLLLPAERPLGRRAEEALYKPPRSSTSRWSTPIVLLLALCLSVGCRRNSEAEAFDHVVATLSLREARAFIESYPDSERVEELLDLLRETCLKSEQPRECLALMDSELPNQVEKRDG